MSLNENAVGQASPLGYSSNNELTSICPPAPHGNVLSANPTLDSISNVLGGAPRDYPALPLVISSILRAVQAVKSTIEAPSSQLLAIETSFRDLETQASILRNGSSAIAASALHGRLTDYPGWAMALAVGEVHAAPISRVAAGIEILWGLINQQPIPARVARTIRQSAYKAPFQEVSPIVDLETEFIASIWKTPFGIRLIKVLSKLLSAISSAHASKENAEKWSFESKARGQILGRANFSSISSRTGTATHRELNEYQTKRVTAKVATWIESPTDERAVAAVITALSGLTIDLIHQIPLVLFDTPGCDFMALHPRDGVLYTNLESLAREAAAGNPALQAREGGYICIKPLPKTVAALIWEQFEKNTSSLTLGDLFPALRSLRGHHEMTPTGGEICASWSRWLNSQVAILKKAGLDAWYTAILSNNFGAFPKSKLYYAVSTCNEIWDAARNVFSHLHWGEPIAMPDYAAGFGSRVVPTGEIVRRTFEFHLAKAAASQPGPEPGLNSVLAYHNAMAVVIGFQLAIMLALRERKEYLLSASNREGQQYILLNDKKVPGPDGLLPVPACEWVQHKINQWRLICKETRGHIQRLGKCDGKFLGWLDQAIHQKDVPLICLCNARRLTPIPLGSRHIFGTLPVQLALAPDAGRKLLENDLRALKVGSADIDAVLRHEVKLQAKHSLGADFALGEWAERVSPLLNELARQYFDIPQAELGKGA